MTRPSLILLEVFGDSVGRAAFSHRVPQADYQQRETPFADGCRAWLYLSEARAPRSAKPSGPGALSARAQKRQGRSRESGLNTLLAQSDFLSVHVPLTAETYHSIAAPQLALMKRTSMLINTARGSIVDEEALAEALRPGARR